MGLGKPVTRRFAGRAAPSGRTLLAGGWGCALAAIATAAFAFDVPSGQSVTFLDSFYQDAGDGELTARFRFVMPSIVRGGDVAYADVADDFLHLCAQHALPSITEGDTPDKIIISLSDQPVEFGKAHPNVTQFFEAFRIENDACIWEGF